MRKRRNISMLETYSTRNNSQIYTINKTPRLNDSVNFNDVSSMFNKSDFEPMIKQPKKEPQTSSSEPSPKELFEVMGLPPDCDKVKIIKMRRALREKFSRRADLRRVFADWDKEWLGVIRPEDIQRELKTIGIKSSVKEVKDLLACVTKNTMGVLTFPDFKKLLENTEPEQSFDAFLLANFIDHPSKLAQEYNFKLSQMQKMFRYYLNTNMPRLQQYLEKIDPMKKGTITYSQFIQVMNSMRIPYNSINGLHIKILYFDLGGRPSGLDYVKFLEFIERFKPFELEKSNFSHKIIPKPIKVTSKILKCFQTKEELYNDLTEKLGYSIGRNSLKNYIHSKGKFSKGDVESFLEGLLWSETKEVSPDLVVQALYPSQTKSTSLPPLTKSAKFGANPLAKSLKTNR